MAKLYSEQLYYGHDVGSDSFTVPDDQVWVVRTITAFNGGPITGGQAQLIQQEGGVTIWWQPFTPQVAGEYYVVNDLRLVLPAGFTYEWNNDVGTGSGADVTLNGYALSLP